MAGRSPRRRLGQHFLVRTRAADKLVAALEIVAGDRVLEIGPGRGVLTRRLLAAGAAVLAVEIDGGLVELLRRDLAAEIGRGALELVHGDILAFDIPARTGEPGGRFRVLGNLPYSQTKPILEKLVGWRDSISRAVITVQAEVGRRLTAGPGGRDYGTLSIFVGYHARTRTVAELPARYFRPVPKVDSLTVALDFYDEPPIRVIDEVLFFEVVRSAFNQRRKTLRNALTPYLRKCGLGSEPGEFLAGAGVDPALRPEALAPEDYARLADAIYRLTASNKEKRRVTKSNNV